MTNGNHKRGFITPETHAEWPEELKARRGLLAFAHTASGRHLARRTQEEYNLLLDNHGSSPEHHVPLVDIRHVIHPEGEHIPRVLDTVDGTDLFLFVAPYDPNYVHEQATELFESLKAHGFIAEGRSIDDFFSDYPKIEGIPPPIKVFGDAIRRKLLNGNMHETYNTIRTLVNNGATVTAVMPYHAYGRQNKKTRKKREAPLAKLVADLLVASGAHGVITYDPHAEDIEGFYPAGHFVKKFIAADSNVYDLFKEYKGRTDTAFVYLDNGCFQRYHEIAELLKLREVFVSKWRDGEADIFSITGLTPEIRRAILTDDILATGGTYGKVVMQLFGMGVREFHGYVSHGLFTKNAIQTLIALNNIDGEGNGLRSLRFMNGTPQPPNVIALPFLTELGLEHPLSVTINSIHYRTSTSQHFILPNE